MSATRGGKGDTPRQVDLVKFRENYDRIFLRPPDPRTKLPIPKMDKKKRKKC